MKILLDFSKEKICAMFTPLILFFAFVSASCSAAAASLPDAELARMGLTPRPKQVTVAGEAILAAPITIVGAEKFPRSSGWLRTVLQHHLGSIAKNERAGGTSQVDLHKLSLPHGNEAFRLEVDSREIHLFASGEPGMFRAVGRLARILESAATVYAPGHVQCPAVRISDWPDMPLRGMDLQMAWSTNEVLARDTVEAMARLGFNLVGYELGSRFAYESHPECRQPGQVWTREQVHRLVTFAKARGITPIPCLNAIGHADRAPLVCTLPDNRWQHRVMDLTAPQFYPTFFDLLDELVAAFENPPYIHLGTDECRGALMRLAKLRSRTPDSLYAEFVNRVTAHLREKGVRTVIWSDMLLQSSAYPGEPANAKPECPTDKALDALNRHVIIDYWCYSPSPYRGLDLFRQKSFTAWVSPWYDREGVPRLCWKAYAVGAQAIFGTTWTDASRMGDGLVLTADYAWNAAKANQYAGYAPYAVANELYCMRPRWGPLEARPVRMNGGSDMPNSVKQSLTDAGLPLGKTFRTRGLQFDLTNPRFLGSGMPHRLTTPTEILAAARRGDRLFISLTPGRVYPVDGVNIARGRAQTILYVAERGRASTGTNRWGCEWVVRNGRVGDVYPSKQGAGNAQIPTDGFVISAHGFPRPSGYAFLRHYLHKGDAVEILAFSLPQQSADAMADFPTGRRGIVVLLTVLWPPPEKLDLGEIVIETASDHHCALHLNGSLALPGFHQLRWHYSPKRGQGWQIWPAWLQYDNANPAIVLAYEWTANKKTDLGRALHLTVKPAGRMLGATLLGVSAW